MTLHEGAHTSEQGLEALAAQQRSLWVVCAPRVQAGAQYTAPRWLQELLKLQIIKGIILTP